MEDVRYAIESDPSRAIAANNKLKDSFSQINQVTVVGRDRFISFSNSIESSSLGVLRSSGAFTELNKAAGGTLSTLSNVTSTLDNMGDKSNALSASLGSATSTIGKLGTASLVVSAAFVGWDIGRKIAELTGLDKIMTKVFFNMGIGAKGIAQAERGVADATFVLAQSLHDKYGVAINWARLQDEKYQEELRRTANELRKTTPEFKKFQEGHEKAAKASHEHAIAIKHVTDEMQKMLDKGGKLPVMLDNLKDSVTANKEAMDAWAKSLNLVSSDSVDYLKDHLDLLAPKMDDFWGKLIDISNVDLSSPIRSWTDSLAGFGEELNTISGILHELSDLTGSDTLGNIATAFDGGANAALGFGRIMSGDVLGGIQQVIHGIGQLWQAFKNLFGHDWGKDVSRTLNGLQVSDQMMKQLIEDSKKLDNARKAVFLDLPAIMQDVGVSAQNASQFIEQLRVGFSLLQEGVITTSELVGVLNDSFEELAKASMSSTGIISNQMREIISLAQQFGLEVQAIADFVQGQLTAGFQGFDSVFQVWSAHVQTVYDRFQNLNGSVGQFQHDLIGVISQSKFNHFGNEIVMWVNAMLQSGMSVDQVMQIVGGDLDRLSQIAQQFGLSLSPALSDLIELQEETQKWGPILSGVNAQLVAMANTIGMTQATFNEIVKDAKSPFKDILKDGKLTKAEFNAILPLLMTMIQLSQQFGIKLPKWVQDIIGKAQNKNWLPKDLTATVNVKYNKIEADVLRVARIEGMSASASPGATGGGNVGQSRSGGATGGGTGGGGRRQPVELQSQQTIILKLDRTGQREIAKVVAHMISTGEVPLDINGVWLPLVNKG